MRRDGRTSKWLHSAYIAYGVVFVGVLGGLTQLLNVSDDINYGLVRVLQSNPAGPELYGRFLYPKNWFSFCIIFLSFVLLFPIVVLFRSYWETEEKTGTDMTGVRQDVNDIVRFAGSIISYMYSADVNVGRVDTAAVSENYTIKENGDTTLEATFRIETLDEPAHFWRYWINADRESTAVNILRDLRFEITDHDTGKKLDWLPIRNDERNKMFAVFFPEIRPAMAKTLQVSFAWPGYMRRLIDLGATSVHWVYVSKTQTRRGPVRIEWAFPSSLGAVNCRFTGAQSQTAELRLEHRVDSNVWIYEDAEAMMSSVERSVEFVKAG